MTDLFSPIQVGSLALPNRIIMAPMTRNRAPETIPNALMATYYVQRASAGLLITEGTQISEQGIGYPATPGIHSVEQADGWRRITTAVHAEGGHIFAQLWHCGRISHPNFHAGERPVAPSAIKPAGQAVTYQGMQDFVTPRALESSELPGIVEQYRHAAATAMQAGFDGVELHAANGYLLDQFLRDGSNQRSDDYGGGVEHRARLVLEVVAAVCEEIGADKVGIRLSPLQPFNDMHDSNPQCLFCYVVEQLNHFGLAYLHVTEMGKDTVDAAGPTFDLALLRERWQGVYITNGGYDLDKANAAIASGAANGIAFGTLILANPDLAERFRVSAPLNTPDANTFYGGTEQGYTDYPSLTTAQG